VRLGKLFANKFLRAGICYIPFNFLPLFEKAGVYPLVKKNTINSVIDQVSFHECIADRVRAGLGKKDIIVYEQALRAIEAGDKNIFLSMCDLDGMYHEYGVNSSEISNKLGSLDKVICELVDSYTEAQPNEPIILISDHGICDVHTKVKLDISKYQNLIDSGELVYFYDSLYLQIWLKTSDENLHLEIVSHLLQTHPLLHISNDERACNGLVSSEFGDSIFVLKEGYGFTPNFFGFRCLKSYHGYHPSNKSSKGVVASNFNVDDLTKNMDVYHWIVSKVKNES
jgi:predicted AlkP superfamily pyrophosphatase or phosphodiesterase